MEKPESVRCENCMFSSLTSDKESIICRFNPPDASSDGVVGWPVIEKHWWCGRFRPVDNLTAIEWIVWQKGLEENAKA